VVLVRPREYGGITAHHRGTVLINLDLVAFPDFFSGGSLAPVAVASSLALACESSSATSFSLLVLQGPTERPSVLVRTS
jgi:hypothetical protein